MKHDELRENMTTKLEELHFLVTPFSSVSVFDSVVWIFIIIYMDKVTLTFEKSPTGHFFYI